ncbi:molybdate ABC transporter substrate-binding protein [Eubacteriaceae bacterium ES2]|nr:molybdate ABC transporter substrate-binding protein [Eubacteriaceae bacterium ES2]
MKRIRNWFIPALALVLVISILSGCSQNSTADETAAKELDGHSLFIYCGAGMTKPFEEITAAFKDETGCQVEVVYANAAQIQNQITTTGEGDLFIAGSSDELKPVQDSVAESLDLVKHIPVLAVQSGNPLGINNLNDLTKDGVEVVLGDGEATPIGKIANKALTDLGILDQVNVIARAATAPEIFNALSVNECDAIIVWKENVTGSSSEIVETSDLDAYVKTVPAATLTSAENTEALTSFLTYLNSDDAKQIWQNYGYEVLN